LIEVAKTVLSVRTPFACEIAETNEPLTESPMRINQQPFQNWLVKLKVPNLADAHALLLQGPVVTTRAIELMDLNQIESFADFKNGHRAP
jgi:glycine cleavage system H lipoate-binding protein